MPSDMERYRDETVLTTREVAEWLECSVRTVLRMPLEPLTMRTRERRYLARTIKDFVLGRNPRRLRPH